MMKILVAGGGTLGHISPALAVIASIRKLEPAAEILFVCSGKNYETSLLRHAGIEYKAVPSGKYRRYNRGLLGELTDFRTQLQNIGDLGKMLKGYSYSRSIIKNFHPDVVFVKGGYVGLPVGVAASRLKVPLVIHESDAVMGKTNSILAKRASVIAVSFPINLYNNVDTAKLHFTGNPVRSEFRKSDEDIQIDNEQKPNILIYAGSQGGQAINKVVFDDLELFLKSFNLLHVTGEREIERARFLRHRLPVELKRSYEPHSFIAGEMPAVYQWADIVVGRAGMNSLSELAAMAKPAIIIPLPSSTNNHQLLNARYLARQGAIRLLTQDQLSGVRLLAELSKLAADHTARRYLANSIHKFFQASAATRIAKLIIQNAPRGGDNHLRGDT